MSAEQAILDVRRVTVTFCRWGQTVTALDAVTFMVLSGQWVMLVGHNGSGKSTLLRAISGRLRPSTGQIRVNGRLIKDLGGLQRASSVFHVHQDPLLGTSPKLTLYENLLVADKEAHVEGTGRKDLTCKYCTLLEPLGLSDRLAQLAGSLSGGERQLVALLVARLRAVPLLLLDEPLAALDPAKSTECMDLIRSLHASGTTILQVTHDASLAFQGGERTVMLRNGGIVYDKTGEARELEELQQMWLSGTGNVLAASSHAVDVDEQPGEL